MHRRRVLVSGAGIAGPALALCLARHGFQPTVVETAPSLRTGGQAVDFRGPVHRAVLERLDLWGPIHARRTRGLPIAILGEDDRPVATLPAVMMAGDVEIVRGDLCALLHERSAGTTDYRFDERIVALEEHADGVDVQLARGGTERFAFVVGADGLHSGVRRLVFGDGTKQARLVHHGYRIATFGLDLGPYSPDRAELVSEPGRALMVAPTGGCAARALLVFTGEPFAEGERDPALQRDILRARFAGMRSYATHALSALERAPDVWVDAIATVRVASFSRGRVALLGDAAWGGTLGGQGTPLAIVGAWVLAGELARGDAPAAAFARFEVRMRRYALGCQKGATRAGSFFAPTSRVGLWLRDRAYALLTTPRMIGLFERMVKDAATDFVLPEYAI
jgi:2-polyprenyl-6-methoxyphenol hydroxylase-like FAD-dependent oxidoreductase